MVRSRRSLFLVVAGIVLLVAFVVSRFVCVTAFVKHGVLVPTCPDGELRQTLFVDCQGLRRGAEGTVHVGAAAHYTTGDADGETVTAVRRFEISLSLARDKGPEQPMAPVRGWQKQGELRAAAVVLPKDLPDGDYVLRARVRSPIATDSVDVALPVYAPARIHVITDRPLYQPGNTVQFRAVALRATDFAPIDGRPGRWIVTNPSGEVVLEEKAPAGPWGVVSGSFPLDAAAPSGGWSVDWTSGGAHGSRSFTVEPFTLPRFRVEASALRPFYRAGDRPVVRGKVVYSSGAPVRGAAVDVHWKIEGEWPPPPDWENGALPQHAITDAAGAFELTLPVVPRDLRERVTLVARIAAKDPAGDRVAGSASVLLSEHALQISTVTELPEGGLVSGFNNRLFLRATTAGGEVLANTELRVKRAWEPSDPGLTAVTDADGVAALQIDPGAPVNVVIPPMPVRARPPEAPVTRGTTHELVGGGEPPLVDNLALDRWTPTLAPCARFANDSAETTIGARVNGAGALVAVAGDGGRLASCVTAALRGKRLPAGHERLYQIDYAFKANLPKLSVRLEGAPAALAGLPGLLEDLALDARACLPKKIGDAALPRMLSFEARPTRKLLTTAWVPDPEPAEKRAPAAIAACIERKLHLSWAALDDARDASDNDNDASTSDVLGLVRFSIEGVDHEETEKAEATTRLGYELTISARRDGKDLGSTPLVLSPGEVPPIRLRATPVLATAGGMVEVAILRGPNFSSELPKTLALNHQHGSIEAPVDEQRTARFKLPADARGWFEASFADGHARVYVRPAEELAVSIRPDAERYAPGTLAKLAIHTTAGNHGTPAAVGLFGVDASLAQLVTLPGPDDMGRLRPHAKTESPAFDVLDAEALEMGRIRGSNAAAATVLRVSQLPEPAALDRSIDASAQPPFDPIAPLTESFYNALGELHAQVRRWEESAPKGEQMHPRKMAELWRAAIGACEKRRESVRDVYGRPLLLHRLPPDLLALTDPRVVVVSGTRLPEDVENWTAWVAKEKP